MSWNTVGKSLSFPLTPISVLLALVSLACYLMSSKTSPHTHLLFMSFPKTI